MHFRSDSPMRLRYTPEVDAALLAGAYGLDATFCHQMMARPRTLRCGCNCGESCSCDSDGDCDCGCGGDGDGRNGDIDAGLATDASSGGACGCGCGCDASGPGDVEGDTGTHRMGSHQGA